MHCTYIFYVKNSNKSVYCIIFTAAVTLTLGYGSDFEFAISICKFQLLVHRSFENSAKVDCYNSNTGQDHLKYGDSYAYS